MIDELLFKAVQEAVIESNQPPEVANRIHAWMREMSNSDLGKYELEEFLETVFNAMVIEVGNED